MKLLFLLVSVAFASHRYSERMMTMTPSYTAKNTVTLVSPMVSPMVSPIPSRAPYQHQVPQYQQETVSAQ